VVVDRHLSMMLWGVARAIAAAGASPTGSIAHAGGSTRAGPAILLVARWEGGSNEQEQSDCSIKHTALRTGGVVGVTKGGQSHKGTIQDREQHAESGYNIQGKQPISHTSIKLHLGALAPFFVNRMLAAGPLVVLLVNVDRLLAQVQLRA
jgi:hypothetical protein